MKTKESEGRPYLPYVIWAAAGLILCVSVAWAGGAFSSADPVELFQHLSDAFFIPGALFLALGLLSRIGHTGMFDILSYGLRVIFSHFTLKKRPASFYDFKQEKQEKRGERWNKPALVVGLILFAISVVFLILYYTAGNPA